jgi:integrase
MGARGFEPRTSPLSGELPTRGPYKTRGFLDSGYESGTIEGEIVPQIRTPKRTPIMALSCSMTWQPDKARWRKIYRGKLYHVTCSELASPPTKGESATDANKWWQSKRAEIDSIEIERAGRLTSIRASREASQGLAPAEDFPGPPAPVVLDKLVGALVARYLEVERARLDAGGSVSTWANLRRSLLMFQEFIGPGSSVDSIDADRWEAWWLHLMGLPFATETKRKALSHSRAFLAWVGHMGRLSIPSNLHSRRHKFNGGVKAVPTLEATEVRRLIEAAPGQLRLHLLLMANCGMTQQDISDLRPDEIDWTEGRIVRKRSKTASHASVPTVNYRLWPTTFDLLKRYGQRSGDHALLTESGRPWMRDEIKANGQRSRVDAIKSNYAHLARRLKITTPMKLIRKTSASIIGGHDVYGRYAELFLGHAPSSVADRHYVKPQQELIDRMVTWLGEQYGL